MVREPLVDPYTPSTSDLDLLVFGQVDELLPERLRLPAFSDSSPLIDLIWLPTGSLDNLDEFAGNGVIPHRLLTSRVIYDNTGSIIGQRKLVEQKLYHPLIQRRRITGFLEMGYLTVREMGVTWDFPALALFWLHIAHASCLAAMCDGMRILCPNVYTRPMDALHLLEREADVQLEIPFIQALCLCVDPQELLDPLRRIYQEVSTRFPEPDWPKQMRETTRHEYRYFLAPDELEWRISVAEEMEDRGDWAAAVYYLRFWAYTLARIPMVHQRANEGMDVSFVRPARAVRPELEVLCPEILADLIRILGGNPSVSVKEVMSGLNMLHAFFEQTIALLESREITLPALREWQPFKPPPQEA